MDHPKMPEPGEHASLVRLGPDLAAVVSVVLIEDVGIGIDTQISPRAAGFHQYRDALKKVLAGDCTRYAGVSKLF